MGITASYGSGYGDGYGSGYGYGYGYGDCYGSGYGDGSGYGSGYSDGSGSGYGDGDELKNYLSEILKPFEGQGTCAFWRSTLDGFPANGGEGGMRFEGMDESVSGEFKMCGSGALHATLNPGKWKGERWWIVRLHDPVIGDDDKLASQRRTILKDLGLYLF